MITFKQYFNEENMAGGPGSVFGPGTAGPIGSFGNQFPSNDDDAYAPGDARMPFALGAKKKKKKKKNKKNILIQRRAFPNL